VETVPTPTEIFPVFEYFQNRGVFIRKKPCFLAARKNAQKSHSQHSDPESGGQPATAMNEIFTRNWEEEIRK